MDFQPEDLSIEAEKEPAKALQGDVGSGICQQLYLARPAVAMQFSIEAIGRVGLEIGKAREAIAAFGGNR